MKTCMPWRRFAGDTGNEGFGYIMYTLLETVGVLCLFVLALQITRTVIRLLYNNAIGPLIKKNVNLKEMGRWAGKFVVIKTLEFRNNFIEVISK